jgi:hypothetical protein
MPMRRAEQSDRHQHDERGEQSILDDRLPLTVVEEPAELIVHCVPVSWFPGGLPRASYQHSGPWMARAKQIEVELSTQLVPLR